MFAIKAEVSNPWAETFAFSAQKTMYGGKHIAKGDRIFVFASENEGGAGLVASSIVTFNKNDRKKRRVVRQTPHVSVTIGRTALAKRHLGRKELKLFSRLERLSARDRAQFQILSPGNEQGCRHLGRSGGVPPRILCKAANFT